MGRIKSAASFDMLARGRAREAQGRSIVHLGIGEPDFDTPRFIRDAATKAMQHLIAQNMRGGAVEASETFVKLQVPDEEKILEGTGDATVTRVVVYDNKAKRASGVTAETVLTLKAGK